MRSTTRHWEKGGKINAHRLPTALAHPKAAENEEEDLRLAAGLTTNMIANMGKGKHISMDTLTKICETLTAGFWT